MTQTWEHVAEDAEGVIYARFLGDADRVPNGKVLITHGGIDLEGDDEFEHAVVIEVVPDGADGGTVVWKFLVGSTA